MSTLNSALEDLWQVADGNPGPRPVDSVNSIENHCRECLDDELLGATAQLFGAGGRSVPAIMRHSFASGIDPKSPQHAEVVKLREELLRFIEWLLCEEYAEARELPEEQIAEYATEIVSLCIAVFRKEAESSKVRELSCEALIPAIDLWPFAPDGYAMRNALFPPKHERDMKTNPSIVQVFWDHLCLGASKSTDTVRGHCMRVLGELAHHFPVEVSTEHIYEMGPLYDRCVNTLNAPVKAGNPKTWLLSGALVGIGGLLQACELKPAHLREIWGQAVKSMMEEQSDGTVKERKRFTVPHAALRALADAKAMDNFALDDERACYHDAATRLGASLLLERVEELIPPLLQLGDCSNRGIRNAAVDATREVLKRIARLLCQAHAEPAHRARARAVYAYLRQHVPPMVAKVAARPREGDGSAVGQLVRWVGALAGPMRVFGDEDLLRQQLHDLCAHADDFFQASAARHVEQVRNWAEVRTQQLPAFLEAFAQLLDALPTVDAYAMKTLHELLQLLLRQFGALVPIQRRRNAGALQQLLLALLGKGGALEQLLRPFVYAGLLHTILAASAFARREYVAQLWQPLLDPAPPAQQRTSSRKRRSAGGRDGAALAAGGAAEEEPRRFAVCDRVFGQLMVSLVQMLHKFDLGALSEADEEPAADDSAAPGAPEASSSEHAVAEPGEAAGPGAAAGAPLVAVGGRALVKNVGDLTLFLALIEVCEALLPKAEPRMLLGHAHVLSLELVDKATAYPHVSGFYKLMRLVVLACEEHGYFDAPPPPSPSPPAAAAGGPAGDAAGSDADMEVDGGGGGVAAMEVGGGPAAAAAAAAAAARADPNAERCYAMLGGFLEALLQRSKRFHDELQAAAIALLLAAPRRFVAQQTEGMAEVLTLALGMGHAYKPLALDALDALEGWLRSRELRPLLRPLLPRVLPCLQVYLSLTTDAGEDEASARKEHVAGKARASTKKGKRDVTAGLRARRSTDEDVQLRIVRLLGAVGGDSSCIVDGGGAGGPAAAGAAGAAGAHWASRERVRLEVAVAGGVVLELHLDGLLPRVIELATGSVQYREKVAACELLDAVIKLCIGINRDATGASSEARARGDLSEQYRHLFPAMLRLATDADGFARSLFEPLTFQVIHWFTSNTREDSASTMRLLEAIMGALSDMQHSGQRDFAARCLGEFVKYSIKHSRSESDGALNVRSLLLRLFGLARDPAPLQRLSFALAINATYRQLREDANTLDAQLLELFEKTFFALQLAENDPIALGTAQALEEVLGHLQRVLLRPSVLQRLLERNDKRHAFPAGLTGRDGFAHWLFRGCAQREARARLQACELLERLVVCLPRTGAADGARCKSSKEWVRSEFVDVLDIPICRRFNTSAPMGAAGGTSGGGEDDCSAGAWAAVGCVPQGGASGAWLLTVQAALDCAYRAISKGWLTPEAVLKPSGSLHAAALAARALFGVAIGGGGGGGSGGGAAGMEAAVELTGVAAGRSEAAALLRRRKRDALKSALRLVDKLLRAAPADPRLGALLNAAPRAQDARSGSDACPGSTSGGPVVASAQVCAMLAVVRPSLLGFDPSELDECQRLRHLACELCVQLHRREPDGFRTQLGALLAAPEADLGQLQVGGEGACDALELLALVEGCRALMLADQRGVTPLPGRPLLQEALHGGAAHVAAHLAQLVLAAPADTQPLVVRLLGTALALALALGLPSDELLAKMQDEAAVTSSTGATGAGVRGDLFVGRFERELVAHIAAHPDGFGRRLLLDAPERMMPLLLAVLEHYTSSEAGRELRAEPMVRQLDAALPSLLSADRWPSERTFDTTMLLLRRLLGLGGQIVLSREAAEAEGRLLDGVLRVLRLPSTSGPGQPFARRAKAQALKLLPLLLRWLRATSPPGAKRLLDAVAALLADTMPLSFAELGEERRKEAQDLLVPLLDALADAELRSLPLLRLLLEQPAIVEQREDGTDHAFASGVRSALRAFADATCQPAAAGGGGGGGGARGASAAELAALCAEQLFGDGAGHGDRAWERRQAVLHWLALPLMHTCAAASAGQLVELVAPWMQQLYATFKRSAEKADSLPTAPAALHLELVGRTAAFELLAALTALVPKAEFEHGGRLFKACDDDANIRRRLPEASGKGAKTKLALPTGPVTAALARRFHVAAYSALIEYIVATQSDAVKVANVLFKWQALWENVVDTTRQWDLKAETNWQQAREADQLGLHARAKARAPAASSKYLASQALASSSLSQDIDMIDDAPHAVPSMAEAEVPDAEAPADAEVAAGAAGGGGAAAGGAAAEVVLNAAFLKVGDTWPLAALLPREPPDEEGAAAAILLEHDPGAAGVVVAKAAGRGVGEGLWGAECALRLGEQWFRNVADSTYELDELNEQPIMQALLRGVDSLRRRGLEGRDGASGMPLWMHQLHAKLDAPALLKAGDTLRVEPSGTTVTKVGDASGLAVDGRAVGLWRARPLPAPLTVTLQGVMGRWGEFIDLSRSVHPPLPALVQPGDKLKVLRDGTLQHVVSRQKLPRTDAPRAALPPARTNDDVIEVPPHAATTAGATMTLPQGASFVNPAAGRLLLNPSQTAPQVQLTIARLVLNRQALFQPHARHWARPLLQLVFDALSDPLRAGTGGEHCLHYLARDLLSLVCSWPADALPADDAAATLVSDLLEKLFKLCQDHDTALLRENVRIVKRVLEQWGPRLSVRRQMVLMLLCSSQKDEKAEKRAKTTGLHLLNAIVSNELSAADDAAMAVGMAGGAYERVRRDQMLEAVLAITIDARGPDPKTKRPRLPRKALYVPAAQLLGQLLAQAQAEGDAAGAVEPQRKLADHLSGLLKNTEAETRTLCELLDRLSVEWPAVLWLRSRGGPSFAAHCATMLCSARVFGDSRVKVINCLARAVHTEAVPPPPLAAAAAPPPPLAAAAAPPPPEKRLLDEAAAHRAIELVVRQRESGCQLAVVRLVAALCKARDAKAVLPVLRAMDDALAAHRTREVRKAYYELLIALHAQDAQLDEQSRAVVHTSLLRGLSDPDDVPSEAAVAGAVPEAGGEPSGRYDATTGLLRPPLRAAMAHYWHTARLPPELPPRLLACFTTLYSSTTEREWVQSACDVLLRVAADARAYEQVLFPSPLDVGCKLSEYRVRTSAGSASQAMQPWGSQSQSQASQSSQSSQSQSQSQSQDWAGMLRATQDLAFSQTQDGGGGGGGMASTYSSQGAAPALLFAPRRSAAAAAVPRFDEGTSTANAGAIGAGVATADARSRPFTSGGFSAENARERRRRRGEGASQLARAQKVSKLRSYRIGEVPDVAIKPADLLAPLAQLAQHDPRIAKDLLVRLWRAAVGAMHTGSDSLERLRGGVKELLRTRRGCSVFVACLHELALGGDELGWLVETEEDAVHLAVTARKSGNLHTGVRLLEQLMLSHEGGAARGGGGGKRSRTAAAADARAADPMAQCVRLQLVELYHALGEEDIVRGLSAEVARAAELGEVGVRLEAALAAQSRGDAAVSLESFDHALEGLGAPGREAERSLALAGRHASLLQLGQWERLKEEMDVKMAVATRGGGGGSDGRWAAPGAEVWLHMWMVAHCKTSAAVDGAGWGRWPSLEGPLAGGPDPRRDEAALLADGKGVYLGLERLARDEGGGTIGAISALLAPSAKAFVAQWATLHPLATAARRRELRPLQMLTELGETVALLQDSTRPLLQKASGGSYELGTSVRALIDLWRQRVPSATHQDVSVWDDVLCCRRRLLATLERKLEEELDARAYEEGERDAVRARFGEARHGCLLSLLEHTAQAAREQGNFNAATSYIAQARDARRALGLRQGLEAKVEMLRLKRDRERARRWLASDEEWATQVRAVHEKAKEFAGTSSDAPARHRVALAVLTAQAAWDRLPVEEAAEAAEHGAALTSNGFASLSLDTAALVDGACETMRTAVGAAEEALAQGQLTPARMAATRLALADCCDRAAARQPGKAEQLTATAIEQVFRAMRDDHASADARSRLVSALAAARDHPALYEKVAEWALLPPCWTALGWTGQLVAMLNEPHGACAAPLLLQLAERYPQAAYFPFQVSRAALEKRGRELGAVQAAAVQRLGELLRSPEQERLAAALEDLTQPHLRLKDVRDEVATLLKQGRAHEAQACYVAYRAAALHPEAGADGRGKLLQEWAKAWGPKLDQLCGKDGAKLKQGKAYLSAFTKGCNQLLEEARREHCRRWGRSGREHLAMTKLSSYSAYLHKYDHRLLPDSGPLSALELPGQYTGHAPPQPECHVVLECVAEPLLVLESMRLPKRLTFHCSDQAQRRFLVKGGEDLRLDQRVQQLMSAMNATLDASAPCAARGLRMRTYAVAPLSTSVGLLEWMDGSETLRGFMEGAIRRGSDERQVNAELKQIESAHLKYVEYANKLAAKGPKAFCESMIGETASADKQELAGRRLEAAQALAPKNLLGRGILAHAAGAESFLAMRATFASSLAALTVAQYVLGIGDRHLENFMIEPATGRAIAIDFGMAFGHATYMLPVPELMAVRLTAQMTSFLQPLDTSVLLKAAMQHTLGALREKRDDLLRLMEVFVAEPLLDWEAHITKLTARQKRAIEQEAVEDEEAERRKEEERFRPGGDGFHKAKSSFEEGVEDQLASGASEASGADGASASARASAGARVPPPPPSSLRSFAQKRMSGVREKLSGGNSARVTLDELRLHPQYDDDAQMLAFEKVVLGPEGSLRRTLPRAGLSLEQQVDCLVEQATDPCVLGWTFGGWRPWF